MYLLKVWQAIKAAENRESFFRIIATIYPTLSFEYKLIEKAYNDSKDAFRGKNRESGERYFEHLRAVTLILIVYLRIRDYRLIVALLLHDIVEDIPSWPIERVVKEYGMEIAKLVQRMSKSTDRRLSKEERNRIYHGFFESADREFFLLKLCDRLHNLLTLWDCSIEKVLRKIEETKKYYLPYAEKHFILFYEISEAIEILERKIARGDGLKKKTKGCKK